MHDFEDIKVGDRVIRILGGKQGVPMRLVVTEVTDGEIRCGVPIQGCEDYWRFDRTTGMEIDDDLEWGPKWGVTGSIIEPELCTLIFYQAA